jgi:hypothetical protein
MKTTLALVAVAAALSAAPAGAANMKCIDRDGRCIVVTVNGQRNVKMSKATKKLMEGMKRVSDWVSDVRYELPAPIQGELQVQAEQTREAGDWFGEGRQAEVKVIPLDDVALQTHTEIATTDSVRAGGSGVLVQQHVLEQKTLPPGRYLLAVTLSGQDNWDRQVLYFQVK